MKSSYQWLQNYVSITVSAEEIADNLTRIGLEAEQIRSYNQFSNSIVIAEILQRKKHPNADHLSLCEVNDGSISPLQVVCGAPNCDSGKKAVFARIGSVLPGGFKLKKRKIRGEYSYGMLCSGQELAIDDNDEDLFILPDDARPGSQLTDYIKGDTIIDWDVTPNRPDCLSHIGIAREIAAITNKPLQIPEPIVEEIGSDKIKEQLTVSVEASRLCTRYHARLFTDVKIGPSPLWMQNDLRAIGLRPINNIVDISNFVLMECGQPLHAFDVGKISGDRIVVRNARECETIRALDEKTYTLSSEDLIIADASKPVALAGIMGGENSAITPDTSSILLESANFRPDAIRKTCKRLGVRSDSSYRFERGIDPEKLAFASRRAAELIIRYAGAKLLPGSIDIVSEDPPKPIEIRIRIERAKRLLGIPIDPLECMTILQSLGLELIEKASDSFTIRVPSHRLDLKTEIDLIEEITRLHGLDKIPISSPTAISGGGRRDDSYYSIQTIHEELIQLGLTECIHSSFLAGYSYTSHDAAHVGPNWEPTDDTSNSGKEMSSIHGFYPPIPLDNVLEIRNPIDQGEIGLCARVYSLVC